MGYCYFGQSLSVCAGFSKALELEVVHLNLCPGNRLCGDKVRCRHPDGACPGVLGNEAKVAGNKLHCREVVRVHVVGRLRRILGLFPVVLFPVVVVVPVVGFVGVPDGVVPGRKRSVLGCRAKEVFSIFAPQALVLPEA